MTLEGVVDQDQHARHHITPWGAWQVPLEAWPGSGGAGHGPVLRVAHSSEWIDTLREGSASAGHRSAAPRYDRIAGTAVVGL